MLGWTRNYLEVSNDTNRMMSVILSNIRSPHVQSYKKYLVPIRLLNGKDMCIARENVAIMDCFMRNTIISFLYELDEFKITH